MKLVDIAYLAGDEKVQMIYTFHIYSKDQRKSKYTMQIFQAWNFMCIANPEVYFREFDGFMKKLFWQLYFLLAVRGGPWEWKVMMHG